MSYSWSSVFMSIVSYPATEELDSEELVSDEGTRRETDTARSTESIERHGMDSDDGSGKSTVSEYGGKKQQGDKDVRSEEKKDDRKKTLGEQGGKKR